MHAVLGTHIVLPPRSGLNTDCGIEFSYFVADRTVIMARYQQGMSCSLNLTDIASLDCYCQSANGSRNTAPCVPTKRRRVFPMFVCVEIAETRKAFTKALLKTTDRFISRKRVRCIRPNNLNSPPCLDFVGRKT